MHIPASMIGMVAVTRRTSIDRRMQSSHPSGKLSTRLSNGGNAASGGCSILTECNMCGRYPGRATGTFKDGSYYPRVPSCWLVGQPRLEPPRQLPDNTPRR